MDERRQHKGEPPDGVEHRRCSDPTCLVARAAWLEEELWPKLSAHLKGEEDKLWAKIRIQMATMIAGTVVFCAGIFMYLSQNAIRDYDLVARDRYTTSRDHQNDMQRIETKITALEISVGEHLNDVQKAIDRNLAAIQALARR